MQRHASALVPHADGPGWPQTRDCNGDMLQSSLLLDIPGAMYHVSLKTKATRSQVFNVCICVPCLSHTRSEPTKSSVPARPWRRLRSRRPTISRAWQSTPLRYLVTHKIIIILTIVKRIYTAFLLSLSSQVTRSRFVSHPHMLQNVIITLIIFPCEIPQL